jgi:hypothetical protein
VAAVNCDVSLKSYGLGPKARLVLDGTDFSSPVKGLELSIDPATHGHAMTLHIVPQPMDVELRDVRVRIDDETHDLLVHLGWTPPPEEDEG